MNKGYYVLYICTLFPLHSLHGQILAFEALLAKLVELDFHGKVRHQNVLDVPRRFRLINVLVLFLKRFMHRFVHFACVAKKSRHIILQNFQRFVQLF